VSELESQIDSFEAELEGLSVKKGKTRPPRLVKSDKICIGMQNAVISSLVVSHVIWLVDPLSDSS